MKDYQLYLVVGALVFVDVVTMTTWQLVDPFYRKTTELSGKVFNTERNEEQLKLEKYLRCRMWTKCSLYRE